MFFNGLRIDSTVHPEGLECIGTDLNVIFFPVAGFEILKKKKKKNPKCWVSLCYLPSLLLCGWLLSVFFFFPIPEFP